MHFYSVIGFALAAASCSNALGINCRGSFQCGPLLTHAAQDLVNYINSIDPNRWYNDGEHIACSGFVCAFLQNTNGAWGYNIQGLAHFITEHGKFLLFSIFPPFGEGGQFAKYWKPGEQ
jgi:hypothetical protein